MTNFSQVLSLLLRSEEVWEIAALSIFISVSAVIISTLIGVPIGVYLGSYTKKDSVLLVSILNTGMGLPPVLVGLIVYLLIARTGPLGLFQILFTPMAMILAQVILTMPIIIGLTRSSIKAFSPDFNELVYAMGASRSQHFYLTIEESKYDISIAIILAFGRAISEVGAILIVGGNIRFHTRVLTTAIITEVSKGQNEFALALGLILLTISYSITMIMTGIQFKSNRYQ